MRVHYLSWDGPGQDYFEGLFGPIFAGLEAKGILVRVFRVGPTEAVGNSGTILPYPRRLKALGLPVCFLRAVWHLRTELRNHPPDAIMVRSSIPVLVARLAGIPTDDCPLIFDADGFMQDERADFAGWNRRGPAYQCLARAEAWAAGKATAVLVRSEEAKKILLKRARPKISADKIFVTTNGRDPSEYFPAESSSARPQTPRLLFAGTWGRQYHPEVMLEIFRLIRKDLPATNFHILTADPAGAEATLRHFPAQGRGQITIRRVNPREMPAALRSADLGFNFRTPAFSTRGVCPIKTGEYLLSGVPVLGNRGVGDLDCLLEGVEGCHLMADFSPESMAKASRWFTEKIWPRRNHLAPALRKVGLRHFDIAQTVRNYADCIQHGAVQSTRHPEQIDGRSSPDRKLNSIHP